MASSAARVVVAGMQLSGMSTTVVTPPAAAAAVALADPSHSVRPGSFTWTCASTIPALTTRSPASIACAASRDPRSAATARDAPALEVQRGGAQRLGQARAGRG